MGRLSRRRAGFLERGIAAVELAIALPFLLLVMLATAELGRLISQSNTLAKSVRDAARYVAANAIVGDTKVVTITPALTAQAANLAVTGQIGGSGVALLPGLANAVLRHQKSLEELIRFAVNKSETPTLDMDGVL